jgi:transposase
MMEAFLDGHVSAFTFFGGVPVSILYDNTRLAVAKIFGDGGGSGRARSRNFGTSQPLPVSGSLRPSKNGRRRFLTPVSEAASYEELRRIPPSGCQYLEVARNFAVKLSEFGITPV